MVFAFIHVPKLLSLLNGMRLGIGIISKSNGETIQPIGTCNQTLQEMDQIMGLAEISV